MKRFNLGILALAVVICFAGCTSKPEPPPAKTAHELMREEASKITAKGGLAAVGIGEMKNTQIAIARAKMNAREELARNAALKIKTLEMAYIDEVGGTGTAEIKKMFSTAAGKITPQALQGTDPKMQKYETKADDTIAYVLMELSPAVLRDALKNSGETKLYERFRSSKTGGEFETEIKAYEEAGKQSLLGM